MPGLINAQVQRLDNALADARKHPEQDGEWKHTVLMASLLAHYASQTLEAVVREAREHGTSWAEIGEATGGITRQAAQQRFGS